MPGTAQPPRGGLLPRAAHAVLNTAFQTMLIKEIV